MCRLNVSSQSRCVCAYVLVPVQFRVLMSVSYVEWVVRGVRWGLTSLGWYLVRIACLSLATVPLGGYRRVWRPAFWNEQVGNSEGGWVTD